jgi:high-affinity iron transporter
VHAGWLLAIAGGFLAWFLSGWLTKLTGAGRELTEGVSSLFAVAVLLYMGFWMHGKSEIKKWNTFVHEKLRAVIEKRGSTGLAAFSFLVVFREAFETVLFLSALGVKGGGKPILWGVIFSLTLTIFIAWLCLKLSRRIPIRLFFSISSIVMAFLSVVLAGKGIKSLQEAGWAPEHATPGIRFDLLGVFPTWETWSAQILILALAFLILRRHKKTTA